MNLSQYNTVTQSKRYSLSVLTITNHFGTCEVALYGAHVTSYIPKDGRERLWMSPNAIWDGTKPLRGGIPVCWPWFGDNHGQEKGLLPAHGFLRDQLWHLVSVTETDSGTSISLAPTTTNGPGWNAQTSVILEVNLSDTLVIKLTTTNQGQAPVNIGGALHSYFTVNDIVDTQLTGLSGDYKDKTRDFALLPTPELYRIEEETDRIHLHPSPEVDIHCGDTKTRVKSNGHDSVVVWNPWKENSLKMVDMSDDGYKFMVCVETALTQGFELQPGKSHALTQTIC